MGGRRGSTRGEGGDRSTTDLLHAKVCVLGAFAVGKTSLVTRATRGTFTEAYRTTVGVKLDRKLVVRAGAVVGLVLWDLHGEDQLQVVSDGYLKGSVGYLLVVDPTRPHSLEVATELGYRAREVRDAPCVVVCNKVDLHDDWAFDVDVVRRRLGGDVMTASALTGEGVEAVFAALAGVIAEARAP